ncbi:PREDICTED: glutamate receptor ionotropic, kainate 1-like [Rhagoletis zephyria]|uniref:glutamate receptor ionotropic, kainate 1-like n=1 Tax=Rhagoletis zephyria TaxID=28612 RepID=UPI0008117D63|nr:PREDICTED: glutamate receptor ionotropic, kainate 1-like [Rhagoletis zephyria]XP_017467816.1 PREDICTED: glutamate receptor ionotropic, kainate 1-like [Rhagoletis zephyria]
MIFYLRRIQYTFMAILALYGGSSTLPPVIRIGAISSGKHNGPTDLAFKYAINSINQDKSLLPETKLTFDLQHVAKDDSFHACQKELPQ